MVSPFLHEQSMATQKNKYKDQNTALHFFIMSKSWESWDSPMV